MTAPRHGIIGTGFMGGDQHNWRVDAALGGASRAFADIGVHWCDLVEFVRVFSSA